MMIGAFVFRACLVWLLLSVSHVCAGEDTGLVALMNTRYFALPAGTASRGSGDISYPTAVQNCEDNGGVLAAGYNKAALGQISTNCLDRLGLQTCITFTGANGDTTVTAPQCDNEPSSDSPSTTVCTYRYRFGFFDKYTYAGEPGTAFWLTYYAGGSEKEVNGYSTQWSTIFKRGNNKVPYGRKKVAAFLLANSYTPSLIDINNTPSADDPVTRGYYIAVCEVQNVLFQFSTTEALPQPIMRQSWKDLTWAQSHWYVIFVIIAVIILIILIVIIILCACTRREKPTEPSVNTMVMHEHSGDLYSRHTSKVSRDIPSEEIVDENPFIMPPPPPPQPLPPYIDPEDMVQLVPSVHNTGGDTLVYSEGNSIASSASDEGEKK